MRQLQHAGKNQAPRLAREISGHPIGKRIPTSRSGDPPEKGSEHQKKWKERQDEIKRDLRRQVNAVVHIYPIPNLAEQRHEFSRWSQCGREKPSVTQPPKLKTLMLLGVWQPSHPANAVGERVEPVT